MDTSPDFQVQTDATGTLGYGAYFQGRWIYGQWTEKMLPLSIEFKELYAIVAACYTWGHQWKHRRILFHCDNSAAVACMKSGTSRSPHVMRLIRSLYHVFVKYDFLARAIHIPGVSNTIADSLFRNLLQTIRRLAPSAAAQPDTPVLPQLA